MSLNMEIQTALAIVENRLLGPESIPVHIREMQGINTAHYHELKEAVAFLIGAYKDKDTVPKLLALAFVDISNHFFVPNLNYSTEEQEKLEDCGIELSELANQLFI
jgi:hypothetical protein